MAVVGAASLCSHVVVADPGSGVDKIGEYIRVSLAVRRGELATVVDAGIDGEWVGRLLVIVSLGSIVGCLVATVISNRFGLAKPLLATLAIMAAIVGVLVPGIQYSNLLVSLALFNFLWIFIDVYQMGTVAVIDRRGSFAALMPGAQGLGQIVGPIMAATLLGGLARQFSGTKRGTALTAEARAWKTEPATRNAAQAKQFLARIEQMAQPLLKRKESGRKDLANKYAKELAMIGRAVGSLRKRYPETPACRRALALASRLGATVPE